MSALPSSPERVHPDPLHPANVAARVARWGSDGVQGPLTLEVYPTLRCNLDCGFCDTTERHRPPVDELSTQRWLEIIDEAADMGVRRLFVLGGGEPLARRDATPAIMRRAKEHGMEGVLTTNGTLFTPELMDQVVDTGWDEIHFSVDGPDAAIHDHLRGQKGAFKKTIQAACALAVRKRRNGLETPRIALHFVLTRTNWKTLPEMVRLADSIGAFRIDFDALIAYTPEQKALALGPEERSAVADIAEEARILATERGILTTLEHFADPDRLDRGAAPPSAPEGPGLHGAPCLKAWHYLVVQADGRTSPCCVLAGEGGSVATRSLTETWASDPFLLQVRDGMANGRPLDRCRECSWNILAHEAVIRSHLPPP